MFGAHVFTWSGVKSRKVTIDQPGTSTMGHTYSQPWLGSSQPCSEAIQIISQARNLVSGLVPGCGFCAPTWSYNESAGFRCNLLQDQPHIACHLPQKQTQPAPAVRRPRPCRCAPKSLCHRAIQSSTFSVITSSELVMTASNT